MLGWSGDEGSVFEHRGTVLVESELAAEVTGGGGSSGGGVE